MFLYSTPQLRRCTPATSPADISTAQPVFPLGQRIAILKPYHKVMADGTLGVRVDNPDEATVCASLWLDTVWLLTVQSWLT